jgi:hypothetical protein
MSHRWTRAMPLSGVLFVALVVASSVASGSSPDDKASPAEVISFYRHHQNAQRLSGLLTVIAVVVGVFFFGVLRGRLRQREGNEQFAAMAFGGAILFGAGGCLSAGIVFTLADVPNRMNAGAAQTLNLMQNNLDFALTTAGISALTLTTAIAILRSRMMPPWVGWLSVVIGVVAVAGPIGWFAFLAMGPWVLIVSVLLYRAGASGTTIDLRDQVPAPTASEDKTSVAGRE